jgi:D-alanyl-lipoteichoic acid acyltransferase DltB (MBOAT superfamily)
MLFTTKEFLLALALTLAAYFALAPRFRPLLLLVASYAFYAAGEAAYVFLLMAVSLIAWLGGIAVERVEALRPRRLVLALVLVALFAPLVIYKYADFFMQGSGLAPVVGWSPLGLALPLGISFFTFQGAGYVIDVYRRDCPAVRGLLPMLLYKAYFPQLIAGPIERAGRLLPQLMAVHRFDFARVADGSALIVQGLFKKLVIADNLAVYVNPVYAAPQAHHGLPLLLATLFFAFQIYCDFSGYIDMARGMSRLFGIELMRNFDRPYGATSITDFWRRWHISLSTWFRDYVYIPLGGNRVALPLQARNLFVVFLISGLWHGAAWTFVAWGALHGAAMAVELLWRKLSPWRWPPGTVATLAVQVVTFILVCTAWVFFRAASVGDALHVLGNMLPLTGSMAGFAAASGASVGGAWVLLAVVAVLWLLQLAPHHAERLALGAPWPARWAAGYAAILAVLFLAPAAADPFLYFRF